MHSPWNPWMSLVCVCGIGVYVACGMWCGHVCECAHECVHVWYGWCMPVCGVCVRVHAWCVHMYVCTYGTGGACVCVWYMHVYVCVL